MNGLELLHSVWPAWAVYIYLGVVLMVYISAAGMVLARLGFKPLWALLVAVPVAQIAVYWVLAYRKWPREKFSSLKPADTSSAG